MPGSSNDAWHFKSLDNYIILSKGSPEFNYRNISIYHKMRRPFNILLRLKKSYSFVRPGGRKNRVLFTAARLPEFQQKYIFNWFFANFQLWLNVPKNHAIFNWTTSNIQRNFHTFSTIIYKYSSHFQLYIL